METPALPSALLPTDRPTPADPDLLIVLQTNELSFDAIGRANLPQFLPDLHRKWAYSLWMLCILLVPQRISKAVYRDTFLKQRSGPKKKRLR